MMLNCSKESCLAPILKVDKLYKSYGKKEVLHGISFELFKGEIVGFLGPNGAGKTTTIKCILGLGKTTNGTIEICNQEIENYSLLVKNKIGAVLDTPSLYNYLTAEEHLKIPLYFQENPDNSKIDYLLQLVGLKEARKDKVNTFSAGMKQRLALALALLGNPGILLLDEPLNALDPRGRREFIDLIKDLAKKHKKAIFFSTHLLKDVEEIGDRVIIIHQGDIILDNKREEIIREGKNLETIFLSLTQ